MSARQGKGAGPIRLGINIDHVATLRNARGQLHPDPLRARQTICLSRLWMRVLTFLMLVIDPTTKMQK